MLSSSDSELEVENWAAQANVIVAGEHRSSTGLRDTVELFNGRYISAREPFPGSLHAQDNSERMNAALWAAYTAGYKFIITTDDTSKPVSNRYMGEMRELLEQRGIYLHGSHSGFLNIGTTCNPVFNQRGNPHGVKTAPDGERDIHMPDEPPPIVVAHSMSMAQPDCDAAEHFAASPYVKNLQHNLVVQPGVYAAFGRSVNMWRRQWAPVAAVWPQCGAYGDILPSFLFHRLAGAYNAAMHVGGPVCFKKRTEGTKEAILEERFGSRLVYDFCARLNSAHISRDMPLWMAYSELVAAVEDLLHPDTIAFAHHWVRAWKEHYPA